MRISVLGLGYVGTTNAVCLAKLGHRVVGVDVKAWKVDAINGGRSPIREKGLDSQLHQVIEKKLLRVTTNTRKAVANSDLSLICVGTPPAKNGSIDLTNINRVAEDVGMSLRNKRSYHLVVIRSTIPPGTTEGTVVPLIESFSNKKIGADFGVCVNPEFLREGSMVEDFMHPDVTVIGEIDRKSGDLLEKVYCSIDTKIFRVDIRTAEMVKFVFNTFHALKISFANEIGNICAKNGVDSFVVSKILCSDNKLNISPTYLRPGFAFGGSCLQKDLQAIIRQSRQNGYVPRLLESVLETNEFQKEKAFSLVKKMLADDLSNKKIAVIGAAFKENTDDIRESPTVFLIDKLLKAQASVRVFDPAVLDKVKAYFKDKVGYSESLEDAFNDADLCIVSLRYVDGQELIKYMNLMSKRNVLDLIGIENYKEIENESSVNYVGICW